MTATPKTALVTGAAGAIGQRIAAALVRQGHRVVLLDRDERVEAVAAELSAGAHVVDLGDRAGLTAFTERFLAAEGGCDILVNNAGLNLDKPDGTKFALEEVTDLGWDRVLDVNLRAPFHLSRAFAPGMKRARWGRIVTIASRAGRTYSPPSGIHYSVSKAGLIGMSRVLAGELGPFGVTANCVAPGRIATPMTDRQPPELVAAAMRDVPAGRVGTPDEIAATVAFLVSDGAAYITGATIDVNGGTFIA